MEDPNIFLEALFEGFILTVSSYVIHFAYLKILCINLGYVRRDMQLKVTYSCGNLSENLIFISKQYGGVIHIILE